MFKFYVIKIRKSIDIIVILCFYEKSTLHGYKGWSQLQFETFLAYEIVQTAEIIEKSGLPFQNFYRCTENKIIFLQINLHNLCIVVLFNCLWMYWDPCGLIKFSILCFESHSIKYVKFRVSTYLECYRYTYNPFLLYSWNH